MVVVIGQIVGDARELRVNIRAAEILRRHFLAGRRFHERRAAEKNGSRPFDDDRFVRHRGHVCAACGARAHHRGDLRDALRRQARLIEEDAAKMFAVGKHIGLQRQKRAARIDEIQARQPVLERDLLRAEVLLHGHRIVRAALHRGVVRDDDDVAARHAADACDDAGTWGVIFVHAVTGERRQLEERRARIDEARDALAHRQLALLSMALHVLRAAPFARLGDPLAQLGDELRHALLIRLKRGAVLVDDRFEFRH